MTQKRHYESTMVFNARIVNMRHLWEPSREFEGVPSQKPNYFYTCIVPKTRGAWWEEASFAGMFDATQKVMAAYQLQFPYVTEWPVKDGDMPDKKGRLSEWAKGHWVFGGSSSDPINVEIVQNGVTVKLANRGVVKPGDYVACGLSVTVRKNDARAFKTYGNSVLFMGAGEEIAIGNSVSGAELMAQAKAQGLNPVGFSASPGGFGGAPQGGFPTPGSPSPVGGFAPPMGGPAQAGFASPPNAGGGGGFASPSNPGGFAPPAGPQGFGAPQPGFTQGAPMTGAPAFAGPAPGQMQQGGAAFPSSAPAGFPGAPGAFPGR